VDEPWGRGLYGGGLCAAYKLKEMKFEKIQDQSCWSDLV